MLRIRAQWDLVAFETVWIACAVIAFVVGSYILGDRERKLNLAEDLVPGGGVALHPLELLFGESRGLVEDIVLDCQLADVVEQGSSFNGHENFGVADPADAREAQGISAPSANVPVGRLIFCIHCQCE